MCLKATCQIIIWLGIFYKSQYTYKHAVARWKWKAKVEDWSLASIHLCSLGTHIKLVEHVGALVRAVHLWLVGEHERLLLMTHLGLHFWRALLDEGLVHDGVAFPRMIETFVDHICIWQLLLLRTLLLTTCIVFQYLTFGCDRTITLLAAV